MFNLLFEMPKSNAGSDEPDTDYEIDALVSRKQHLFAQLTRINGIVSKTITSLEADIQLRACSKLEEAFSRITEEILNKNAHLDAKSKISTKDFDTFQALIDSILKCCYKVKANDIASSSSSTSATPSSSVEAKLPKISIPVWSGDIKCWNDFITQYNSLVHTRTIKDSLKLQYLRSSLRDEPLSIVSKYPLVDASYDLAYKELLSRYQNPRRLGAYHIHQILDFKANRPSKDKRENVAFLQTHRSATSSLKNLGVNDLSDFLLFQLCYQNLSTNMQVTFDREFKSSNIPTLDDLFNHIEAYARAEELHSDVSTIKEPVSVKKNHESKKSFLSSKGQNWNKCAYCSQSHHKIFKCSAFLGLPVADRQEKVKTLGLCNV